MWRRVAEALTLNAAAAMAYHTLVLACRYVEARRQMGGEAPGTAEAVNALCGHCRNLA